MADQITTDRKCKKCGADLTLEEMHYYEREDGSATCNNCEAQWLEHIENWRHGRLDKYPEQG